LTGPPRVAGAWTDLLPNSRTAINELNTFPVQTLGFAGINQFKVRWINVPSFAFEGAGSRNTVSISLFDDGTGIDENANQPLNPANPIGNNAVPFDLQEGPTDRHWLAGILGRRDRADGTGRFMIEYGLMDTAQNAEPALAGYSAGGL